MLGVAWVAMLFLAAGGGDTAGALPGGQAARLAKELGPGVTVALHRRTGEVRFVGTSTGRPIPRPAGLGPGASPVAVARAFLDERGGEFGLTGGSRSLRVTDVVGGPRGEATVRLRQEIDGVPVLAGELVVDVDSRGNVLSVLGEAEPDPVDTVAQVGVEEARRTAVASVAKAHPRVGFSLRAGEPQLEIYDSRLLGGPGLGIPTLVWAIEVLAPGTDVGQLVLVDAKIGVVAQTIGLVESAKDRRVCDAEKTSTRYPCKAPYDREEGDLATGSTDIDSAYDFAGDTYDFYSSRFGRDSLDGAGLPLISTVRYCPKTCPYKNAFWDGSQMVYGPDFAAADDVVGHELSHGFTQFTSGLFYWYQSGAINESMSDIFGELIDLANGAGTDTASVRWLLGEDIPKIGAIRSLKNPPEFNDPDKMTSSLYTADVDQGDEGGVHTNSGVGNKAAYLITDGATFNGKTVTGIGIDKAARVYYTAESNLLTSGSDYADLYEALQQACTNSIGGKEGISTADCQQVTNAVNATEMNQQPLKGPAPEAPVCGSGQTPSNLFFDDLENPASGNWTHGAQTGTDGWYYPQNPNPFGGFDATYATSGETNIWGNDQPSVGLYSIAQTTDVAIPAGSVYLRFDHSYAFEDGSNNGTRYDGGQLQYSTDGGSSWQDAGPLFTDNGYNGTLYSSAGNPLGGQKAFTAESYGYISSRVDLSSLAGKEVRFRFRIGTDESADDYGWFIDDIRVYSCEEAPDETPPDTTIDSGPEEGSTTNDPTPTFSFSANEEAVLFECATDAGSFSACTSPHTTSSLEDGAHTFKVRAKDKAANTDPSPAQRSFTVDGKAPAAPQLSATNPASPANENKPLILGTAEANSTARLYSTADCSGTPSATGTAANLASPGLQVSVADNSTTTFRATAEDAAGNLSPCSSGIEYVEESNAPNTIIDSGPEEGSTTNDPTPTFSFSANEEAALFECATDAGSFSACTSPHTTSSLADGAHTFKVRAKDKAANTDPSPAQRSFTVDAKTLEPPPIDFGPVAPEATTPVAKATAPVARVVRTVVPVRKGMALLPMRCVGEGACQGAVTLMIVWAQRIVIGRRGYAIYAGRTATIPVRLNRRGRRFMRRAGRRGLRARAEGAGLENRTVRLKLKERRRRS
jgi:bacillolysin